MYFGLIIALLSCEHSLLNGDEMSIIEQAVSVDEDTELD